MSKQDLLIGRTVRVNEDATTLRGRAHPNAGQEGVVEGKTPGGRQYQIRVGEDLVNLPMADFAVVGAATALTEEHEAEIDALAPSRTNRKVVEDDDLLAMAATIKVVGILEPIVVRPLPGSRLHDTFERPETRHARYEIIAGERRWVAARLAGLKRVPILAKQGDDALALIMQLIENLHRRDLNPLEEARGIQRLLLDHGYTREDAADAVHKSRTHVFESLRLLSLCPEALAALEQGTLKRSMALLVAQRPTQALQAEFTKRILTEGPGGTPLSYRSAADLAKRNYMTDLAQAPFALDDAKLCPAVGACKTCPKRTGANPELWDKSGADVCTDTACFADKKEAHYERLRRQAAERGQKVITGREAREIMPRDNATPSGYMLLDKPSQGSSAPLRQVLGQDVPASKVVLIETPAGELVEAVPTRAAGAALEARGKSKAAQEEKGAPAPTREELEADYQRRWRGAAVRAVIEGLRNDADPDALAELPEEVAYRIMLTMAREAEDETIRAIFDDLPLGFSDDALAMKLRSIARQGGLFPNMVLMMLAVDIDRAPLYERPADEALQLEAAAPIAQVDLDQIRAQVQEEMKAEAAERAEAANPKAAVPPDLAKPKLRGKGQAAVGAATRKTSAAEAQAAIAEALQNAPTTPIFIAGQAVRIKCDVKGSSGGMLQTKGRIATVVRASGARKWVVSLPDPWPFPGTDAKPTEVTVDYTELEPSEGGAA